MDAPVAWPEISDRLNDAGKALWERALAAEKENQILAATRDELLPLLMSGKITVKDAEKSVEGVL
ncbi:type I restriction endonuclease subunit S [Brachybacterium vulturis]|uniref:Type I restriction endonuclease subunit S n=1 Tax=Brachybacterium vulturis TaxID=2017484 RepID=A0A291GMV8_9MICO|nr:type I restriction endonuclease subunit S [Brachybacterium vulturis]